MLTMTELREITGLSRNTLKERIEANGIRAFSLKTETNTLKYLYDITESDIEKGALNKKDQYSIEKKISKALSSLEKAMDSITYARLKGA